LSPPASMPAAARATTTAAAEEEEEACRIPAGARGGALLLCFSHRALESVAASCTGKRTLQIRGREAANEMIKRKTLGHFGMHAARVAVASGGELQQEVVLLGEERRARLRELGRRWRALCHSKIGAVCVCGDAKVKSRITIHKQRLRRRRARQPPCRLSGSTPRRRRQRRRRF